MLLLINHFFISIIYYISYSIINTVKLSIISVLVSLILLPGITVGVNISTLSLNTGVIRGSISVSGII